MVGQPMFRAFAVFLALATAGPTAAEANTITVLAAASLTDALQAAGKNYEAATGDKIRFSFASSMTLARQIEASAGADVFVSADVASMDYLESRGLVEPGTRTDLLHNSLVLIAPADSTATLDVGPEMNLLAALKGGRLAIADPTSVPAGRYAAQALRSFGVWDSVKDRLAPGEDVRATLAYVARGEAPFGIVYATDAQIDGRVKVVGRFPASSHAPIIYPAALIKGAAPGAARFLAYLKGPKAGAVFSRYGFSLFALVR
jgi:molybdate transport system substrate-binding protein